MTTLKKAPEAAETRSPTAHPLDPLTPGEIVRAVEILNRDQEIGTRVRYETVVLNEPPKDDVLAYDGTNPCLVRLSSASWTTTPAAPTRPSSLSPRTA